MKMLDLTYVSYGLLYTAVLCLWLPSHWRIGKLPLWSVVSGLACLVAVIIRQVEAGGLMAAVLLGCMLFYAAWERNSQLGRLLGNIAALVLALGLGAHAIPAFHNVLVLDNVIISDNGSPFSMYLNFDKALAGLLILGIAHRRLTAKMQWLNLLKITVPYALLLGIVVLLFVWAADKVVFDPKLPASSPIWLLNNLLFVCMAEEAFFRGFVQKNLAAAWSKYNWGAWLAIGTASLLFGAAHYAGGAVLVLASTLAGVGYSWLYYRTSSIEASILAHFLLNLLHFLLFTYPFAIGS